MLVVMAVMMILAMFMVPTLKASLHRAKVVGTAKQISIALFQARFEAIKKGAPVVVAISGSVLESTSGGTRLSRVELPGKVSFEASQGFGGTGTVSFQSDGSADKTGAFRIVDGWGNQMEIAVEPQATARVQVRKKDSGGVYRTEGTGGVPWTFQ
jgi:Tfp pilus assembly protein FimT